jgi:hypothetical protein
MLDKYMLSIRIRVINIVKIFRTFDYCYMTASTNTTSQPNAMRMGVDVGGAVTRIDKTGVRR